MIMCSRSASGMPRPVKLRNCRIGIEATIFSETPIYTASKFGLRGAMLAIGLDLSDKGILAGSVLPSATDTRMLRQEAVQGGNTMQFQDPPQQPAAGPGSPRRSARPVRRACRPLRRTTAVSRAPPARRCPGTR
jgi:NAD(P)-dependent dehydrogenase (short-subunit alcohol dehydrogenase family)